jgi:site-specific recombinase XerD
MDEKLMTQELSPIVTSTSLEVLILGWFDAKFRRSKSTRTRDAYQEILGDFRNGLLQAGLDLDSQEKQDLAQIALLAQAFAGGSKRPGQEVSSSTYNLRLSVLSSFYEYAIKQTALEINPINRVERAKVQEYAHAQPMSKEEVERRLGAIDRTKLQGKRDYALLTLLLQTGRRLTEMVALECRNLQLIGDKITVTFERCKGGKTMIDTLPPAFTYILLDWLKAFYGAGFIPGQEGDTRPIWVCLIRSGRGEREAGDRLEHQGIANICERWLGTSKVHVTRHTWARIMEDLGAKVSDIQARLGHESLATTGRYLAALKRADNPYGEELAAQFGIK